MQGRIQITRNKDQTEKYHEPTPRTTDTYEVKGPDKNLMQFIYGEHNASTDELLERLNIPKRKNGWFYVVQVSSTKREHDDDFRTPPEAMLRCIELAEACAIEKAEIIQKTMRYTPDIERNYPHEIETD